VLQITILASWLGLPVRLKELLVALKLGVTLQKLLQSLSPALPPVHCWQLSLVGLWSTSGFRHLICAASALNFTIVELSFRLHGGQIIQISQPILLISHQVP